MFLGCAGKLCAGAESKAVRLESARKPDLQETTVIDAKKIQPRQPTGAPSLGTAGRVIAATLMCELFLLCVYFIVMSLLMRAGLEELGPWQYVTSNSSLLGAVLCFAALLGLFMCLDGRRSLITPVKRLLITFAVLSMSVLPIALYDGLDDKFFIGLLCFLEVLSFFLFINTVAAFQLME
jgi:hypothetical protein